MKLNEDKCHLLDPGHKHETEWVNVKIWRSQGEKSSWGNYW